MVKCFLKTSRLHKISITEPLIDGLYGRDYELWFYRIIKMKSRWEGEKKQHRQPINPKVVLAFQNQNQLNKQTASRVTQQA